LGAMKLPYGLAVDPIGRAYVMGAEWMPGSSCSGAWVAKWNLAGSLEWQRDLSGASSGCGPPTPGVIGVAEDHGAVTGFQFTGSADFGRGSVTGATTDVAVLELAP